jgi:GNAT superfamily N-acetyltransferase
LTQQAEIKPAFQIRSCRPDDFATALRLLGQLWPDKDLDTVALRQVFDHTLESASQIYLCAENSDGIIGFASLTIKNNLWRAANLGHIDELIVEQSWRNQGLGTQLLEQIIARARETNCTRVELDSAFHRTEAHRFCEQHGFENRAYLFSKTL